jgi:hypothetical protein
MPILLWLSAGEAPAPLLVWRLSLLLSTYFFLCANVLFVTKSFCAIVVDIYFGALLAYYADHVFGTRIGTVTIYLNSIFTAAFAGYALAERRRSDDTEQSADNVPAFADEEEEEYARAVLISSAAVISITLLFLPPMFLGWFCARTPPLSVLRMFCVIFLIPSWLISSLRPLWSRGTSCEGLF